MFQFLFDSRYEVLRVPLFVLFVFVGSLPILSVLLDHITDFFGAAALVDLHLFVGERSVRGRIAKRRLVHDDVTRDIFKLAFCP